jgi:hypothetical protein
MTISSTPAEQSSSTRPLWFAYDPLGGYGVLVAIAGCLNFLSYPLMFAFGNASLWIVGTMSLGMFAGQLGLAALWMVWGPGSFLRRWLVHWGIVLGLYLCTAIGMALALRDQSPEQLPFIATSGLFSLPFACLATQLLLWPLRLFGGWRIVLPERPSSRQQSSAFTILDLILGTISVALALGGLRLMPGFGDEPESAYLLASLVVMLILAGITALVLVPAILAIFRFEDAGALGVLLVSCTFLLWSSLLAVATIFGLGGSMPAEVPIGIGILVAGFAATLGLPLLIVRSQGYRLVFGNSKEPRR